VWPSVRWSQDAYSGYGECQPNFTVASGEIFHTMDLLVAVPYSTRG
jgi:hypothetical protein